jgi:alpha/beta superfamily hydrolase
VILTAELKQKDVQERAEDLRPSKEPRNSQPSGPAAAAAKEDAGYLEVAGDHVYTVLHEVASPVARVLLVGPFAPERCHAYLPLARWARYLATRGIEVVRFDYRGVGESTGVFSELSFSDWMEDVTVVADWFQRRAPKIPFLIHGLSLGAVLAGRAFDQGVGDGLLLWAPPPSANAVLRSALMSWITLQKLSRKVEGRKTLAHYLEQFDKDGLLEVNGYVWSSALWRDSFDFQLPAALSESATATSAYHKPVRVVDLGLEAAPLVRGGVGGYEESNDLGWLFSSDFEWIRSAFNLPGR